MPRLLDVVLVAPGQSFLELEAMAQTISSLMLKDWRGTSSPRLRLQKNMNELDSTQDSEDIRVHIDSVDVRLRVFLLTEADIHSRLKAAQSWIGYEILKCESQQSLLGCWDQTAPDLLMIDQAYFSSLSRRANNENVPIIVFETLADTRKAVEMMKQGAFDIFPLPADMNQLLKSIRSALEERDTARVQQEQREYIEQLFHQLTRREKEVMSLVIGGFANKEIATTLTISLRTVEAHRSKVLKKMEVSKSVELLSLMNEANLLPELADISGEIMSQTESQNES